MAKTKLNTRTNAGTILHFIFGSCVGEGTRDINIIIMRQELCICYVVAPPPIIQHSADLMIFCKFPFSELRTVTSDLQWIQASLPVRDGGLGIRRVASLALPAFLALAASILSLQADILSSLPSNLSGTVLACWQRRLWWSRHSTRHIAEPRSWLLVQNIAVTSYLPFHLPRVGFV